MTKLCGVRLAAAILAIGAAALLVPPAAAQRTGGTARAVRADLADMAAGAYAGDVISDARGSSRSGVRVIVTKIGPNQVRVAADYARLPAFTARLTRAMDTIQNASGDQVFLLDLSKSPRTLMVTVDDASWAGARE